MHAPSQPFDAITAFTVPNPNCSSQSQSVFSGLVARPVTLPSGSPSLHRIGNVLFSPTLSAVDGSQVKYVSALSFTAAGRLVCRAINSVLPNVLPAQEHSGPREKIPFQQVPFSVSGITWKHVGGRSHERYLPETAGPGCAFLDYYNDGWMDIYLVNSGPCDFYEPKVPLRNALYRNNRDGTFTDVAEKTGVAGGGYGMGVAVGDYDGDGFPDLYVTQYGRSILYQNNGNGTFSDITEKAGVAAPGWATSAV